ncbi:MAG: hypothetical protein A2Z34_11820 [Planctomycetes bacterium RBG_16_59_8]|nr:MAG: hypothetical protein A2Z34_11820 [Planctomycetes bacterium RBG_16_59_8]
MKIILAGIGGQGILFTTRVVAEAAIASGMDILCTETHGMAQRGGSVISHVKIGDYRSPLIRKGSADAALCFKESELATALLFLKPGGECFINAELDRADPEIEAYAHRKEIAMHRCPAQKIAADLGSPRSANQVLLGALSRRVADLPSPELLADSIATVSGNRGKEANLSAFTAGREWKPA